MKIILFGTGEIFRKYKMQIKFKYVTENVENSEDKHN